MKQLCINLAKAESEEEVIALLKKAGYWDKPEVWNNFGDNENNFATIGNQQSRPEAAIVEKLINSVDAVLMAECLSRNIDPAGEDSPTNIAEALERFFKIPEGKLTNISANERSKLANRIFFVATGEKSDPCYSIIDTGEGQTPKKMPETLLSIGKSNKLRIPFVQGKFNMGGTGVFQFCGKNNLQLIISKRHPEVAKYENDSAKDNWGFTIVRREDPSQGVKSSIYRYLAPSNQILSFKSDGLSILPGEGTILYGNSLQYGTFIKLYEYQMTGLKRHIRLNLFYRLSLLMPEVALPIRFYERRDYTDDQTEITLSGLLIRLEEDKRVTLEDEFKKPPSSTLSGGGQRMKASIYVFKKDKESTFKNEEGIIFTINGQTHGTISKSFFSRNSVGMGYLANSILIILDCSEFDGRAREDLFMNSRDRLRSGKIKSEIESVLEDLVKNHPGLRLLKERRKREAIQDKIENDKPLVDVIDKILKKSPTLSKLFIEGVRLPSPFNLVDSRPIDKYKGQRFPTFFNLVEEYSINDPKVCPINRKFRVQFKTDAENDYFVRDNDSGDFNLFINEKEIENYSLNLWNGLANLTVNLPTESKIDDLIKFEWEVADNRGIKSFCGDFYVRVNKSVQEPTEKSSGSRRKPSSEKNGDGSKKSSKLAIPEVIEVHQNKWNEYSFDEESALKVINNGDEGYDFFVNMDNKFLLTEKKNTNLDFKLLDSRFKYGLVLIGLAFLNYDKTKLNDTSEEETEDICSKIEYSTRAIGPFLLPMISELGDLEIAEMST
ncbi:MAG: hypothetical protein NTY71_04350 [Methanoregula sp.]|nr:hypothetical protein [Methanoregula sp.]